MTTGTAVPPLLSPEQLLFLWEARAASALLAASLELGVIDRPPLEPLPGTAESGRRRHRHC